MITFFSVSGAGFLLQYSAVAWLTRSTLSKVNSSAMTALQPSVPNLMLIELFDHRRCLYFDQKIRHRQRGYSDPRRNGTHLSGKEFPQRASNWLSLLGFIINYVNAQRNHISQLASCSLD